MEIKFDFDWKTIAAAFGIVLLWLGRLKDVKSGLSVIKESFSRMRKWCKSIFVTPGAILARLDAQDAVLQKMKEELAHVKKELQPNSGSSLRDAITQIKDLATVANDRGRASFFDSPVAIYECEAESGNCIWVNAALCEIFGLSPAEMLGRGWLSALHTDDTQPTWDAWNNMMSKDIPYHWKYRIINQKTKKEISCVTSAIKIKNPDGKTLLIRGKVEIVEPGTDFFAKD